MYSEWRNKRDVPLKKIAFFAKNGRLFQVWRLVNFQIFPKAPIILNKKKDYDDNHHTWHFEQLTEDTNQRLSKGPLGR